MCVGGVECMHVGEGLVGVWFGRGEERGFKKRKSG